MGVDAGRAPDEGRTVPDGASNVLLVAPARDPAGRDACVDLLLLVDPPEELSMLGVTLTKTPERWIAEYASLADAPPAELSVIAAGDVRSAAAADDAGGAAVEPQSVETVAAGDLAGLGVEITDHLAEHIDGDAARRPVVCVNSVSALLEHAPRAATFEFLQLLAGQVRVAGGVAHYHVDPDACDAGTLAMLDPLFDAVVRVPGE